MKRRGFTLWELLVVMAIVGGLFSLLHDTFSKSPALHRAVACRSNLKRIGRDLIAFRRSHQGRLPSSLLELKLPYKGLIICPVADVRDARPSRSGYAYSSYAYRPLSRPRPSDIIAWDPSPHIPTHSVFTWNNRPFWQVLRADGSVSKLDADEFAALKLRGKSESIRHYG